MANSPVIETLSFCACGTPYTKQLTADVKIPSDGVAIAKVLAIPASARITSCSPDEKQIAFGGVLTCRVLYVDGEGARKVGVAETDFADAIKGSFSAEAKALASVSILDTDTLRVGPDSLTLRCVLEVRATVFAARTAQAVTSAPPEVYTQTGTVDALVYAGETEAKLVEEGAKELADLDGDVLLCESAAYVTSIAPRADAFVAELAIVSDVVYRSTDGQLKNVCFSTPVTDEIALGGLTAESTVETVVAVADTAFSTERPDGATPSVKCSWTLSVRALGCRPAAYPVVTDAFSVTNGLTIGREPVCACSVTHTRVVAPIEGSAVLEEGMPSCDTVLGVAGAHVAVANVFCKDGRIVAEGILHSSVLYLNKEFGTTNSVAVELPFSLPVADGDDGAEHTVSATVVSVDAKTVRTGKIDLSADVHFDVAACVCDCVDVVSAVEVGEPRAPEGSGITVYIAGADQSLWDVAKALCVTPETVLALNPDVTFPTAAGQKIVLYRQLVR